MTSTMAFMIICMNELSARGSTAPEDGEVVNVNVGIVNKGVRVMGSMDVEWERCSRACSEEVMLTSSLLLLS